MRILSRLFCKKNGLRVLKTICALMAIYWVVSSITGLGIRFTMYCDSPSIVFVGPSKGDLKSFNEHKPFRIVLGRGSGWHGFDTIDIQSNGEVVLYQMSSTYQDNKYTYWNGSQKVEPITTKEITYAQWERTKFQLTQSQCQQVGSVISDYGIGRIKNSYSNPSVRDGTQWVLRIFQENQSRRSYFNNYFPSATEKLAQELEKILRASVVPVEQWKWELVPINESRKHEQIFQ